jgi:hypothetical protein
MNTTSNSRPDVEVTDVAKVTKFAVPVMRYIAAGLGIVAGLIHLSVTPENFDEAFAFGLFMLLAGIFQVGTSVWLVFRPSRLLVFAIIAVNAAIVLTYAVAYTVGLPFGPDPGKPQTGTDIGSATTLGEIILLLLLILVMVALVRRGGFHQIPGRGRV